MYFVGIDPGANAGFAMITGESSVIAFACNKHLQDVFDILEKLTGHECIVGLEDTHAIWGSSASSTFGMGISKGFWMGILKYLNLAYTPVSIKSWQSVMMTLPTRPDTKGLTNTEIRKARKFHKDSIKLASLKAAQDAFPNANIESHDVADAINIARYVRSLHKKEK